MGFWYVRGGDRGVCVYLVVWCVHGVCVLCVWGGGVVCMGWCV